MKTILYGRKHGKENFEMIAGPNVTTSDQITLREDINKNHPVNDTWAEVHLIHAEGAEVKGRLRLITSKDAEAANIARKQADVSLDNSRAEAEAREKKRRDAAEAEAKKKHAAEVAALNEKHDATRESLSPTSPKAKKIIEQRTAEQDGADEAEQKTRAVAKAREELAAQTVEQLQQTVVLINNEVNRKPAEQILNLKEDSTKEEIIEAILKAKGFNK